MLAVGRLHVLKSFPTARPSPAPPQQSLHTPSPQCSWSTNNTDTRMVRSAAVGSTLRRPPDLRRVDVFTLAENTPPCAYPTPTTPPLPPRAIWKYTLCAHEGKDHSCSLRSGLAVQAVCNVVASFPPTCRGSWQAPMQRKLCARLPPASASIFDQIPFPPAGIPSDAHHVCSSPK